MTNRIFPITYSALFALFAVLALSAPATSYAATPACSFERDLTMGILGDDVKCLQKFLNESGYTLTSSGPGSRGSETDKFGAFTRDALALWQKENGISPASGYFGARTRAALAGTTTPTPTAPSAPITPTTGPTTPAAAPVTGDVQTLLNGLSGADRTQAENLLALVTALGLTRSSDDAEDADEADDEEDTDAMSDDVRDTLDDLIEIIKDARDALEDEEYDDADDFLDDAQDAIREALGGNGSGTDAEARAERAIEGAKDAIADAEDAIDEAQDDDEDTDEAEEYLDDAEDALQDAEDAFEDEEYADALDFAKDAKEYAADAEDSL